MKSVKATQAELNVQQIMKVIRERVRNGREHGHAGTNGTGASPPAPPFSLEASRTLPHYPIPPLPDIGAMPDVPPTLRGRFGALLVRVGRRLLFWYTQQIQGWRQENFAWRATATRAVGEQAAALLTVQSRLEELERQFGLISQGREDSGDAGRGRQVRDASEWKWPDAACLEFEDRHRGASRDIRDSLRAYLPHVRECGAGSKSRPIVDLGSGRGEWLDLLRHEDLHARGVDSNRFMVEHCARAKLEVAHEDLLSYLRSLPSRSCGLVSAFHVIEHLPAGMLFEVIDEISRVLKSRGLAIVETPNPENLLVSSHSFYLDPTHYRPLPPDLLEFVFKNRGFRNVELLRLHPDADAQLKSKSRASRCLNERFHGPRDYAVIGRKY